MQIAEPFITRSQLEQKFAQVKNLKSMSTQSKPPLGNKPGTHRESSAELDRLRAENATLRAKLATAKPTAPTAVPGLSPRDQRRAAAKGTLADQSDSQLQFIAGHRSAPAEEAAAARTELQARGWTCHDNGNFSMSTVKKSRR